MKYLKLFIPLALFIFSFPVTGQYADLQSVVYPGTYMNTVPNGTQSQLVIINGYDNIFLGTDFGEPYIATNPRDLLNSVCAYNFNSFYYILYGYNFLYTFPP